MRRRTRGPDPRLDEFLYAPEAFGVPKVVHGKEALHKYLSYALTQIKDIQIGNWVVRQTTDPKIWYVEYTAAAAPTGRHYEQTYIARVELKNGKFQVYREFWDPLCPPGHARPGKGGAPIGLTA